MATLILPKQVPLDRNVIDTQKGPWLVRAESVVAADESQRIVLHLVLDRLSDEGCPPSRRLYTVCSEGDLQVPQRRVIVADHIRRWLESTEGNGVFEFRTGSTPCNVTQISATTASKT